LEELARDDADPHRTTVISYDMIQSDDMPSIAPQNVLWARHQHVFAGMSWDENKLRYFQYLYYMNVNDSDLDVMLKNDFVSKIALFGWARHTDRLSSDAKTLTYREIYEEVKKYRLYREQFSKADASNPVLSFAVVNRGMDLDFSKLDRWYERDAGEDLGRYTLYKLKLREEPLEIDVDSQPELK
jgi:hypothetical protein